MTIKGQFLGWACIRLKLCRILALKTWYQALKTRSRTIRKL